MAMVALLPASLVVAQDDTVTSSPPASGAPAMSGLGQIAVTVLTEPPGLAAAFRIVREAGAGEAEMTPVELPAGGTWFSGPLSVGTHGVLVTVAPASADGEPADSLQILAVSCDDAHSATPSTAFAAVGRATFGVDEAEFITCTFTTGERTASGVGSAEPSMDPAADPGASGELTGLLLPREGSWRATNRRTVVVCASGTVAVKRTRDRGTLRVRDEGRVLIGRGLTDRGSGPLRMELQDSGTATYQGTQTIRGGGASTRITFEWRVVSEVRIEGSFHADITAGGEDCTMDREFDLDHIGDD